MSAPVSASVTLGELAALLDGVIAEPGLGAVVPIRSIELTASAVEPGGLFAAAPGHRTHGARFASQAVAQGAVAILTDAAGAELVDDVAVPVLVVRDPRRALPAASAAIFRTAPADLAGLRLLGVTGTNGKTTVNAMLDAGLRACGERTAIVGTTGTVIDGVPVPTARTTPEAPHLHALLRRMIDAGVQDVCMEVSSIALEEHRVDGLRFTVAGFTNLTQDHLDYHGSMEAYFLAKARLFTPEHAMRGVIGIDDDYGRRLAEQASVPVQTWSIREAGGRQADWRLQGAHAVGPGVEVSLHTALPGEHNRANALLALAMLDAAGLDVVRAAQGVASVVVAGRMEVVRQAPIRGIVDYAHSPDAIERVLAALRPSTQGRIIAVLGAGGDRDREKRPLMGAAAARLADIVVVTDDNPRSEDPAVIRAAVRAGAQEAGMTAQVLDVAGRADAIGQAVALATDADTVVVLGKGHETGQEIAGVTHPFDDRVELARALEARTP